MTRLQELHLERKRILDKIEDIVAMRRGSVVRQYFPVVKNGNPSSQKRGPYPVFSYKKNGKTVSRRIRSAKELRRIERQVMYHRNFQDFCQRLVEIGEEICSEQEKMR
jgi:hypothetical protein